MAAPVFGVSLRQAGSGRLWGERARRVEELGYDLLVVPDHEREADPFAAVVAAASVTHDVTVATFVVNAGLHTPQALARRVRTARDLSDGRFVLGLGAGYDAADFRAAGFEFPRPRERVDHLRRCLDAVTALDVPVLVGGAGPRTLGLAGAHGAGVAISSLDHPPTADGSGADGSGADDGSGDLGPATWPVFRQRALDARAQLPPGAAVATSTHLVLETTTPLDLACVVAADYPWLTPEELLESPAGLVGTRRQLVERVERLLGEAGITHFVVPESAVDDFLHIRNLIEEVRRARL